MKGIVKTDVSFKYVEILTFLRLATKLLIRGDKSL